MDYFVVVYNMIEKPPRVKSQSVKEKPTADKKKHVGRKRKAKGDEEEIFAKDVELDDDPSATEDE